MAWRPRGLWRQRDFVNLWLGRTISEFGSRITREGLPLTAALLLGATPAQMGILAAMGAAPVLLVGLLAGVWVDRRRRRPILIAADVGRAALLLSIPLAFMLGRLTIEQLYVVAALTGVLTVFFDVADQSFLPSLVSREHLVEGNSKLEASGAMAEIGGPALAGVLVQTITGPIAILLDACSFLVSAATVIAIRKPEPPPAPRAPQASFWYEAAGGLRFIARQPMLRAIAGFESIGSFFGGFYAALYTLYTVSVVGVSPAMLGVLVAGGGIGGLLGTLITGPVTRRLGRGATMVATAVLGALLSFNTALAAGPPLIVGVALLLSAQVIGDCFDTVFFINAVSLRQQITPDPLLGRMNAGMRFLTGGVHPFGILLGGALGGLIGMQNAFWIAGAGGVLAAAWIIRSPIRQIDRPPAPVAAPLAEAE
ncbi:MAG TPA: MFS transporter [Chloroflexia bacterium]|jgi:MFS family permease|nr:MFS transporter [Chloroflexia bacterium]